MINRRRAWHPRVASVLVVLSLSAAACGSDDATADDDIAGDADVVLDAVDQTDQLESVTPADESVDELSASDEIVEPAEASEVADRPEVTAIAADATWQWQLQGEINTSYDVDVYDIDLFDAPQSIIDALHADGRTVICYYSAGSFEEWRDDAVTYPAEALGEPLDGWEGERWIDTRSDVVRAIIEARHDLAVAKRCDGVEPDNVTAFQNESGFELTADDQLDFNRFLATSAHERGLLIALKNDLAQISELVEDFDFAVNEECAEFDECDAYGPFVDAGKAVLSAEYADRFVNNPDDACAIASTFGLSMLILPLELDDGFRIACAP